jgi:hypothetical protein
LGITCGLLDLERLIYLPLVMGLGMGEVGPVDVIRFGWLGVGRRNETCSISLIF